MILEAIVTTINDDETINISPMGSDVPCESFDSFYLKPFQTSQTYKNLSRKPNGVLHVTDDVLLLSQSAVGSVDPPPALLEIDGVDGKVLANACRWYAFRVMGIDDSQPRTRIECQVVNRGRLRDFFGFNRAKHAVLEAAILATRIEFLPFDQIQTEFDRLAAMVEKTAGEQEHEAFEFLKKFIHSQGKCSLD